MQSTKFSFFLALVLSLTTIDFTQAMKRNAESVASPDGLVISVHNYCKAIIQALNKDDLQAVKNELKSFYAAIPCNLKINEDNFYRSLSFCLCLCLTNKSPDQICHLYNEKNSNMFLPIETDRNIYILQFNSFQESNKDQLEYAKYTYIDNSNSGKNITILGINFCYNVRKDTPTVVELENDGDIDLEFTPIEIMYTQENNFYRDIIRNLTTLRCETCAESLGKVYNSLPRDWRIKQEKFYQALFVCIITFMGNSVVDAEVWTSNGRADVIVRASNRITILEFKLNESAAAGLAQIKDRDYGTIAQNQQIPVHQIGLNIKHWDNRKMVEVTAVGQIRNQPAESPIKIGRPNPNKKQKL